MYLQTWRQFICDVYCCWCDTLLRYLNSFLAFPLWPIKRTKSVSHRHHNSLMQSQMKEATDERSIGFPLRKRMCCSQDSQESSVSQQAHLSDKTILNQNNMRLIEIDTRTWWVVGKARHSFTFSPADTACSSLLRSSLDSPFPLQPGESIG